MINSENSNKVLENHVCHFPAKKKLKLQNQAHEVDKGPATSKEYLHNRNPEIQGKQEPLANRKNQGTHPDKNSMAEDRLKANENSHAASSENSNTTTERNSESPKQEKRWFESKFPTLATKRGSISKMKETAVRRKSPKQHNNKHGVTELSDKVGGKGIHHGNTISPSLSHPSKSVTGNVPLHKLHGKTGKEETQRKGFRRNLRPSKHVEKSELHRYSLAEANSAFDFLERGFVGTSSGRNKRNNLLYEIKDFIVKHFPQKKRKRKSHEDHKKTNMGAENDDDDEEEDDDGNANVEQSELPKNSDDNATDFDVERTREVLEEVKNFVVKNFHPERVKRMSSSVERSSSLSPPVYTEEAKEGDVSEKTEKVKREENNRPSPEEGMDNSTLSQYDDYYETDHPKRDVETVLSVPENNNPDSENKDSTNPTEPGHISRYPEDTTTIQRAEYSTEPYHEGEEFNNMTEAFSDDESEAPMARRSYNSNLSKGKRESAPYVTSDINDDGTVTGGTDEEKGDEKSYSLGGPAISGYGDQKGIFLNSIPSDSSLLSSTLSVSLTNLDEYRSMLTAPPPTPDNSHITSAADVMKTVRNTENQMTRKYSPKKRNLEKHEAPEIEDKQNPKLSSSEVHDQNQKENKAEYNYSDDSGEANEARNTIKNTEVYPKGKVEDSGNSRLTYEENGSLPVSTENLADRLPGQSYDQSQNENARTTVNILTEVYPKAKGKDSRNSRNTHEKSESLSEPTENSAEKPQEKSYDQIQEKTEYDYESSSDEIVTRKMDHSRNLRPEDRNDHASYLSKHSLGEHQYKNDKLAAEEQNYSHEDTANVYDLETISRRGMVENVQNEAGNLKTENKMKNAIRQKTESKEEQQEYTYEDTSKTNDSEEASDAEGTNSVTDMQNSKQSRHSEENGRNSETIQGVHKAQLDFLKSPSAEHPRESLERRSEEKEYEDASDPADSVEITSMIYITDTVTQIPENNLLEHNNKNNVKKPKAENTDRNHSPSNPASHSLEKSTEKTEEEEVEYEDNTQPDKSQKIREKEVVSSILNTVTPEVHSLDKPTGSSKEQKNVEYEYGSNSEPIASLNLKKMEAANSILSKVAHPSQGKSASELLEEDAEYDYESNSKPAELQNLKKAGALNKNQKPLTKISQNVLHENKKEKKFLMLGNNENSNSPGSASYPLELLDKKHRLKDDYKTSPDLSISQENRLSDKKENSKKEFTQNDFLQKGKNANLENDSARSEDDSETPSVPDIKNQGRDIRREEDEEEEAEYDNEDTSETDNSEIDSTTKINKRVVTSQNGLLQNQKGYFPTEDKHMDLQESPLSSSTGSKNGAQTAENSAHVHKELASNGNQMKDIPGLSKQRQQNKNFNRTLEAEDMPENFEEYGNEITVKSQDKGTGITYDEAKDGSAEYEDTDAVDSLPDNVDSPSPQKEIFKSKFFGSKSTTLSSDKFETKHKYKVRENDEDLKSYLNSLTHSKLRAKRDQYENRIKTSKTREVLGTGPTVLPKFNSVQNSFTKQWLIGIIALLAIISLTLGIYQVIPKRQNPKISLSGDLKEVCINCDGSNPDVFNRVDESEAKWEHDVKQINDFIEETLQNCENSENGNTEKEYSTMEHLAKIHTAITGIVE